MFSLNEILQNAQGGKAIDNLAQRFGLSPEQVQNAVQAMIPALSAALQSKAAEPGALGSVITAITDKDHQDSFSTTGAAPDGDAVQKGHDVLTDLFGSSHIINQVAQQVSSVTGLRPDVIAQLFPAIASIALGGMAQSLRNQGLGGVLGQLASAAEQGNLGAALGQGTAAPASGGFMAIVATVLGGLFGGGKPGDSAAPQAGLDALTKMFQPGTAATNFDQGDLQASIGQILGGAKAR